MVLVKSLNFLKIPKMTKTKKIFGLLWGLLLGNIFCFVFLLRYASNIENGCLNSFESLESHSKNSEEPPKNVINLLMVGVMTAPQYFDTRAKAVYDTWGRQVPGDIKFYSSQGSYSSEIPLIALYDVDDSYPPQKKSLMMLKHMHDNYINNYEWFMRADDDVYIRPDRLEQFLRSVDSRKTWFIGQTGRGNTEEFGLLSLDSDENFCMGGPGVIFSRDTLMRVAPYVEECLRHLYTAHEDVELGRCVRRFAGVSCTWSYQASDCDCEMQVIFYHNQSGNSAFTGELKQKEIHQAITLHPVKQPEHLYRLHKYFKGLKIQNNQHDSLNLQRDLLMSLQELGLDDEAMQLSPFEGLLLKKAKIREIPASIRRHPADHIANVHEWEFLSNSLYSPSDLNPRKRIGSALKVGLADVINEVMELINHYSKQRGRLIEFKEIMYGYSRLNPINGVEYILDLLLVYRKYRGHKMTIQVRRHAYIQQTFTGLYIREADETNSEVASIPPIEKSLPVHKKLKHALLNFHRNLEPLFKFMKDDKDTIHFILPLLGRYEVFERFMGVYEKVCLIPQEFTTLTIILYENEAFPEDVERTKGLVERLKNKYYDSRMYVIHKHEKFSRGHALQYGVDSVKDKDLMLFIDVDMVFDNNTLDRIRMNTVLNKSIYFPVVFSLFNPKITGEKFWSNKNSLNLAHSINEDNGFWRQFGFGIVSLYKSDYYSLGGFNLLITGWGFEDVTFYDKAIKSNLHIVRCADPSLIHIYHNIHCDEDLDTTQKNMCSGTEASALGSLKYLQMIYKKHKNLFDQIPER